MIGASKCKINMLAIFLVLPVSKGYLSVQGTNIQLLTSKTQKSDFFKVLTFILKLKLLSIMKQKAKACTS